jgi:hypothetical protein
MALWVTADLRALPISDLGLARLAAVSVHAFVDESKAGGYYLAAALVLPHRLRASRQKVRALCLPGQQRIHFSKEQHRRRGQIVAVICRLDVEVRIYDASAHADDRQARTACLRQVVRDLAEANAQRLVIEQDDSLVSADQAGLWSAVHAEGAASTLTYEHVPPHTEPLLWVADAAAWCCTRDQRWRERLRPVVTKMIEV